MRRMLTEKDVEKIDSIDPADIETLKATASPKGASSGYVLTADGNGNATYQKISGGTTIQTRDNFSMSQTGYQTDGDGNKYLANMADYASWRIIFLWMKGPLKADGVSIPRAEYTLTKLSSNSGADFVMIYLPDDTIAKYSITKQTKFTGTVSFYYK